MTIKIRYARKRTYKVSSMCILKGMVTVASEGGMKALLEKPKSR